MLLNFINKITYVYTYNILVQNNQINNSVLYGKSRLGVQDFEVVRRETLGLFGELQKHYVEKKWYVVRLFYN